MINIFFLAMFLVLDLCAADARPKILMFVGNPGVGKSSIINALKQEPAAKSGVTLGSGLTQFFSEFKHQHQGKAYLLFDTPGLDDVAIRAKAAAEIEKALKQEGTYKLFFVFTLEAGRIKPSDLTTIEMVLDAIKIDNLVFNIIINKINKREKAALSQEGSVENLIDQINSGKHKTKNVFYIELDRDLEDGEKHFFSPSTELENFIYKYSQEISIKESEVDKIQIDKFEELNRKHQEEIENLRRELEAVKNAPPQVVHHHHYSGGDDGDCAIQ